MSRGFTLIELLVVIAIIAIIASIVTIIINPLEMVRRSRDTTRLSDLANLQMGINILIQENHGSGQSILCHNLTPPCSSTSNNPDQNTRKSDGTGWVKVKFTPLGPITASTLPTDPINSSQLIYSYATNDTGDKWEINATLESEKEKLRMQQDGGNNPQKYEIGLSLNILQ